jgi:hypothetical protein
MTTRQFITRAFNDRKTGKCSSVFADNGDVYSYGYHYPLLFRVHGQAIRNVSGYSVTTQRHIQWSRDMDAIDVHAGNNFRLNGNDHANVLELIKGQQWHIDSLQRQMDAKKRKNTQVYKWLEFDLQRASDSLKQLEALK